MQPTLYMKKKLKLRDNPNQKPDTDSSKQECNDNITIHLYGNIPDPSMKTKL